MADEAATSANDTQITFNIKSSNDQKYVVTVPSASTVADLKAKLATPEFASIPEERQRLIYSGRVLKDPDTLAAAKIKDGHTVHLVKGAASNVRQNPANQGAASSTSGAGAPSSQVPTNLATGTGNNPLAGLTGARYAGFHGLPGADMFGPDGGMGPPPDAQGLLNMMENPMFLSQMTEAMNNPDVIEMMTQSPMMRNNPMLVNMIRNPEMRRMLFNPEMIRMQLQMQQAMGGGGGAGSFPAPGVTDTTPQPDADGTTTAPSAAAGSTQAREAAFANAFAGAGGAGGAGGTGGAGAANPFANLFGPGGANPFAPPQQNQNNPTAPGAGANAPTTPHTQGTQSPPANPFAALGGGGAFEGMQREMMNNPEAMRIAAQLWATQTGATPSIGSPGSNPAAANPFAALFEPGGSFGGAGLGAPTPPADTRPPEEVYESQLRQLNEMGFFEFERNVSALRRSGGNVQGAIEYLLNGA
ncbi:hypothetical protein K505DRAFT_276792 [Melanomma pulvis-pyrius CBS 109.77]|uniref:Ubiquitin-domain-containing protein n=1 Tax=Melanomma pulvis-pyrius CBS 109.77 TaxID=1314802 RepID=A0A6A6XAX7_9PLEO|nr:hypothetical protein K505DRAFT_276792 [Melanomma pulvis-pyrius CBS 109.77]